MKSIRKLNSTIIVNRVLYGILSMYFNHYGEAEKALNIPAIILNRCVIYGHIPSLYTQDTLSKKLNIPIHILFNNDDIAYRKTLKKQGLLSNKQDTYVYPNNDTTLGLGVKKPRFRTPQKHKIMHPILYSLLLSEDIKISELAKELNITPRACSDYIYKEAKPRIYKNGERSQRVDLIEKYLNFPFELMFLEKPLEITKQPLS